MKFDREYLDYLLAAGQETNDIKYLWQCLSALVDAIDQMNQEDDAENNVPNLKGMYKIQPQSAKGDLHKGPPQSIISN